MIAVYYLLIGFVVMIAFVLYRRKVSNIVLTDDDAFFALAFCVAWPLALAIVMFTCAALLIQKVGNKL